MKRKNPTRFIEQLEEARVRACLRMTPEVLREDFLTMDRRLGKTESCMRLKCKVLQRISERHKRFHTRRDRYSAGNKRGRRR